MVGDPDLLNIFAPGAVRFGGSEEIGHEGDGLSGIGSIRPPNWERGHSSSMRSLSQNTRKMRTKTMSLRTWDCIRYAKKPGQNVGLDWVTDHGIRTGGDRLVALLNGDGAAPVAAEILARPDGEKNAGDGEGGSARRAGSNGR